MRKNILAPMLLALAAMFIIGCVPAKNSGVEKIESAKEPVKQQSTKEWKTYVSKYGFEVSYPKDWKLEEDDYALMERKMEKGKAPFYLSNGENNFYKFGTTYENNIDKMDNNEEMEKIVLGYNLISSIDGKKEVQINKRKAFVYWGKSQLNENEKIIITLIKLPVIKREKIRTLPDNLLLIQEEISERLDINKALDEFYEMLKWIKIK